MIYDYAVIGKGLIGSAAARYLSQSSDSVVLIGPDEPAGDWRNHNGVFASHYDQGRITRLLDPSIEWGLWAYRSIAEYAAIEKASGIRFYHPCGGVQAGLDDADSSIARVEEVALHLGTSYQRHTAPDFRAVRPELNLRDDLTVLYEPTVSGYINPRSLVAAQVTIAEQQGATVIRETVVELDAHADLVTMTTGGGQLIQARKVLVAAGSWTEFLTGAELGLIPTPRTIVMAQLDEAEAERLKDMPTLILYGGVSSPHLTGIYMLPPIRYPDGNSYIKLGGGLEEIVIPQRAEELQAWFHTEGDALEAEALEQELFSVVDGLRVESIQSRPCVVTYHHGGDLPVIKEIVDGQVMVATAGCGGAAKSSNEIGRIAAVKLRLIR
ncbi:MAG: FAD-dependent oxidoreductase [Chloroflexota bacterium]